MFTGLIEAIQPLRKNIPIPGGRRLCAPLGQLAQDAHIGDSICLNGVCLTISQLDDRAMTAWFDVSAETAGVSTLSSLKPAEMLNLERALPANGRFGGHIVQGHVDGVGTVDRIESDSSKCVLWISASPELMQFMIEKGSVAIDGVSLTVVDVQPRRFSVFVIPTTLQKTNLGHRKVGDKVNLEADLISKWISKRIGQIMTKIPRTLTMEKLRRQGFA